MGVLSVVVILGSVSAQMAMAATVTWKASASSNLSANGNWNPGAFPVTTDEALFSGTPTPNANLTFTNNHQWGDLVWNSNSSSTIAIESTQTTNKTLTLSGLAGSAAAIAAGGAEGDLIVLGSNVTNQTLTISNVAASNGTNRLVVLGLGQSGNFNVVNSGATLVVSSTISGATAGLNKTGAGTVLLNSQYNSFVGTTTVSAGTLGGSGRVKDIEVKGGATLAPGEMAIGTFSTSNLLMNANSTLAIEINTSAGTTDLLKVNGNVTLDPGATLTLTDLGSNVALALGTTLTILDYSNTATWTGLFTFNSVVLTDDSIFTLGANTFQISYDGYNGSINDITLTTVVPEPTPFAILILGGFFLLILSRRHRPSLASRLN